MRRVIKQLVLAAGAAVLVTACGGGAGPADSPSTLPSASGASVDDLPAEVPRPGRNWEAPLVAGQGRSWVASWLPAGASTRDCDYYFEQWNEWQQDSEQEQDGMRVLVVRNKTWSAVVGCDPAEGISLVVEAIAP